jgi:hypothetical protein
MALTSAVLPTHDARAGQQGLHITTVRTAVPASNAKMMPGKSAPGSPTVAVASHTALPGITNVVLDHERAAELALGHLYRLGHCKIAFMRGENFSSDSLSRWRSTLPSAPPHSSLRQSPRYLPPTGYGLIECTDRCPSQAPDPYC